MQTSVTLIFHEKQMKVNEFAGGSSIWTGTFAAIVAWLSAHAESDTM